MKTVDPDESKTMDYLRGAGFKALYNLTTNTKTDANKGYFSQFVKYFVTDKVEIKTINQLPVYLLHKEYSMQTLK